MKFEDDDFIQLYGFTKDPNTLNYMIVMIHAGSGSLKKNLSNIVKNEWVVKLIKLNSIICGLDVIHQQKMVHCDFHHGNILSLYANILSISDLGLSFINIYDEILHYRHTVNNIISLKVQRRRLF